jgi:hypothetical protein
VDYIEIGTDVRVPTGERGRVVEVLERPWLWVVAVNSEQRTYARDELRLWGKED